MPIQFVYCYDWTHYFDYRIIMYWNKIWTDHWSYTFDTFYGFLYELYSISQKYEEEEEEENKCGRRHAFLL